MSQAGPSSPPLFISPPPPAPVPPSSFPSTHQDYYSLLNIPRNASLEEVKNAYKRMCVLFHPDKHLNQESKATAQTIFNKIHTAYTVLSDQRVRAIYDEHGIEGVEAAWQLGPYLDGDLKRLKEELNRIRQDKALGGWKSKTILSSGIDMTMLMEDWTPIQNEITFTDYIPQVSTLSITQRLEGTLYESINANLSYSTITKNGNGNGVINGGIVKQINERLSGRLQFSAGGQKRLGLGLYYALSQKMSMDLLLSSSFYGGTVDPSYQLTFSRILGGELVGNVTILGGSIENGVAIGINRINETNPASLTTQLVGDSIGIDAKYSHQLDDQNIFKIRLASTNPTQVSFGIVRRFNDGTNRKTSFMVEAGSALGVSVKLTFTIRDIHFIVPVYISREISSHSILLGTGLPTMMGLLIHNFILEPYRHYKKQQFWTEFSKEQQFLIEKRRKEAQLAIDLMTPLHDRRKCQETTTNGLIIVRATYEKASPMGSPLEEYHLKENDWLDVTIPLQMLVIDSQLSLEKGSKADLLGFYDVAIGQQKVLKVEYLFRGNSHAVTICDDQPLFLPMRHHLSP